MTSAISSYVRIFIAARKPISAQALPAAVRYFIELLPLTHTSYLLRGIGSGADVSYLSLLVLVLYAVAGWLWGSRAFRRLTE